MKQVEYWYWRYRSPDSRRKSKTLLPMTAREASHLPEAERIPGTMLLRDVEEGDFEDTSPGEPGTYGLTAPDWTPLRTNPHQPTPPDLEVQRRLFRKLVAPCVGPRANGAS